MLLVVRAADGAAYPLYRSDLQDITTLDELRFNLLSPLLQIPPECLICMNEEGAQLRNESVPSLAMMAGSPSSSGALPRNSSVGSTTLRRSDGLERRLYVFDREHLDSDPEDVSHVLAISEQDVLTEPPLEPQDPLSSHIGLSHHNLEVHRALISSISLQRASLQLALSNLNRVMTGTSTSFGLFLDTANPNLEAWTRLLEGWEDSMDAVGRVSIVDGLVGRGHSREGSTGAPGSSGKDKERFLGDYVSRDKMLAVRDGCARVLVELKERTEGLQMTLDEALEGTAAVQAEFDATSRDLEDLEACEQDADHAHARIEELVRAGDENPELLAQCFEELSFFDAEHRDRINFLVQRKNAMSKYLVHSMQRISNLQSDIAEMPGRLGELDGDMRTRTDNFKHLARLEGLVPAYVATVVEVVRRRTFARLLQEYSTSLSGNVTHLSTIEREQRTSYRTTFSGKLPWEVRGLSAGTDEAIPEIDFDLRNGGMDLPELSEETLHALGRLLDLAQGGEDARENAIISNARKLLDDLMPSMDRLRRDFSSLSAGETSTHFSDIRAKELEARIHALEQTNEQLERDLQSERSGREEETAQLEQQHASSAAALEAAQTQLQSTQQQLVHIQQASDAARDELERERLTATRQLKETADERQRLVLTSRQAEQVASRRIADLESRHAELTTKHSAVAGELAKQRTLVKELEEANEVAQSAQRDLAVVVAEKDRLLRDHKGEAELDRAVLEREMEGLRAKVGRLEEDLKERSGRAQTLEEIADGLRSQISRWEKLSEEGRRDNEEVKAEAERAKQEKEVRIVEAQKNAAHAHAVARRAIKTAVALTSEHEKIIALLNASSSTKDVETVGGEELGQTPRPSTLLPETQRDIEVDDLEQLLASVQQHNADKLTDAVRAKVDSLTVVTKKWIREAKAYRERSHRSATVASDKIAFRNFVKGDLALFLPTRNSAVPVWAAFNVSFPHHFLAASGIIAEQMKTREWIVARITSLTERVADSKDASSNPYQLTAGTKYFLLEVEPWSSKESGSRSRRHSSAEKSKSRGATRSATPGAPTTMLLDSTDSGVPADSPPTASPPRIRRSVSEGGAQLPPNATSLAKSEYAIVEEPEAENVAERVSNDSGAVLESDKPPALTSAPSGLSLALAGSASSSPVLTRNDPFSTSPFGPVSGSSPPQEVDVEVHAAPADFEPTITPAGAVPAFLPSGTTKRTTTSSAASSTSTASGPRYIRSASRPQPLAIASPNRTGTSPGSATGSQKFVPRSASSGSSILSSSMHRRSGPPGAFPISTSLEKAQATQEAQTTDSRWNLMQEDLARSDADMVARRRTQTAGRQAGKGWPGVDPSTSMASRRAGNLSSSSFFEALTGRKDIADTGKQGVEGEIRKLLNK